MSGSEPVPSRRSHGGGARVPTVGGVLLALSCVGGTGAADRAGAAEADFPARPIRMVVPYPAGSGTDTIARLVGQRFAERLGGNVVVDNRPGGASVIGLDLVAKANPDGHTLLVAAPSFTIVPALRKSLPFDPRKDFTPVIRLTSAPLVLVVPPSLGVRTVEQFVTLARQKPGQLNFASGGVGGSIHMGMELVNAMAGIKVTHVAYKGSPQALVDLLAGQVHAMTNIIASSLPHIARGRLIALGVTGPARIAVLPDTPTIAEAGISGYEVLQWHGLLAPAGTPASVVKRLEQVARSVVQDGAVRQALTQRGFEPADDGPERFAALLESEREKWARVVRQTDAGAK